MKEFFISHLPPSIPEKELVLLYKKSYDINGLLRNLDVKMSHNIVNHQIVRSFRMKEALESTRIEGTQTTIHDILEARITNKDNQDIREVLNYILALNTGKDLVEKDGFIANRTFKQLHKLLLQGDVRGANCDPGEYRKVDNWLGQHGSTRETASYIPPSSIEINDYMANLEKYINNDDNVPVTIKCAISHAQFESIHPFLDGNGRVGRMLIPLIFKLNNDDTMSNLFISKQLEQNKFKYYELLNGTRKENPEWFDWVDFFLDSIIDSIKEANEKYDRIIALYEKYQQPDDLSYTKVLDCIFLNPITSVSDIVDQTNLTRPTIAKNLNRMSAMKIIYKSDGSRNIRYYFYDLLNIL